MYVCYLIGDSTRLPNHQNNRIFNLLVLGLRPKHLKTTISPKSPNSTAVSVWTMYLYKTVVISKCPITFIWQILKNDLNTSHCVRLRVHSYQIAFQRDAVITMQDYIIYDSAMTAQLWRIGAIIHCLYDIMYILYVLSYLIMVNVI